MSKLRISPAQSVVSRNSYSKQLLFPHTAIRVGCSRNVDSVCCKGRIESSQTWCVSRVSNAPPASSFGAALTPVLFCLRKVGLFRLKKRFTHLAVANKFLRWCLIFGEHSIWNLFYVALLAPRLLLQVVNLGEIFVPLVWTSQMFFVLGHKGWERCYAADWWSVTFYSQ
jgi:hypothetical protein